jgi:hypothetical protein
MRNLFSSNQEKVYVQHRAMADQTLSNFKGFNQEIEERKHSQSALYPSQRYFQLPGICQ